MVGRDGRRQRGGLWTAIRTRLLDPAARRRRNVWRPARPWCLPAGQLRSGRGHTI